MFSFAIYNAESYLNIYISKKLGIKMFSSVLQISRTEHWSLDAKVLHPLILCLIFRWYCDLFQGSMSISPVLINPEICGVIKVISVIFCDYLEHKHGKNFRVRAWGENWAYKWARYHVVWHLEHLNVLEEPM